MALRLNGETVQRGLQTYPDLDLDSMVNADRQPDLIVEGFTPLDDLPILKKKRGLRRIHFAIGGAICTIIMTVAAIPGAAFFVQQTWCSLTGCRASDGDEGSNRSQNSSEALPAPSLRPNICQFHRIEFQSLADQQLGLSVDENRFFHLTINRCIPSNGEFHVVRDGFDPTLVDLFSRSRSSLFGDNLNIFFSYRRRDSLVACSFESESRRSRSTFRGRFSCQARQDPSLLSRHRRPLVRQSNLEGVLVTLE
jgi:hypothetical protein